MTATLSMTLTIGAQSGTYTTSGRPDADGTAFLDLCWANYPQYNTPGDPSSGLKPKNNANLLQAFRDACKAVAKSWADATTRLKQDEAGAAAKAGVTPTDLGTG